MARERFRQYRVHRTYAAWDFLFSTQTTDHGFVVVFASLSRAFELDLDQTEMHQRLDAYSLYVTRNDNITIVTMGFAIKLIRSNTPPSDQHKYIYLKVSRTKPYFPFAVSAF